MLEKSPAPDRRLRRYDHLIVHCSATKAGQSLEARDIDKMHRDRGWNGCGYNAIITRAGTWQDSDDGFPTRPIGEQGAHVGDCGAGWNGRSFGVCLIGGIDDVGRPQNNFTAAQFQTLAQGIETFRSRCQNIVTVLGHRDLIRMTGAPPKACPCFDVRLWLSGGAAADEDGMSATSPVSLARSWTVQQGDTLWEIAQRTGIPTSALIELNPTAAAKIIVGQVLKLR